MGGRHGGTEHGVSNSVNLPLPSFFRTAHHPHKPVQQLSKHRDVSACPLHPTLVGGGLSTLQQLLEGPGHPRPQPGVSQAHAGQVLGHPLAQEQADDGRVRGVAGLRADKAGGHQG